MHNDYPSSRNPYDEPSLPARLIQGSLRFLVFIAVVVVFFTGLIVVYGRLQEANRGTRVVLDSGADTLSTTERVALQGFLLLQTRQLNSPIGPVEEMTPFTVSSGQNANQIAIKLTSEGVLDPGKETLFINYLRFYALDSRLTAGDFLIPPNITIPQLADILAGTAIAAGQTVRFVEGWRVEQMADSLRENPVAQIDPDNFLALVRRQQPLDLTPWPFLNNLGPGDSLEGFLFPDTYQIATTATSADLLTLMLRTFDERVTPAMRQAYGERTLSVREAVILASIVEREAVIPEERPLIAGVFLNRLAQGIRLDADPTVQYAVGYDANEGTWWKRGLTVGDLQVDSPYNTYQLPGLPPSPIANPGLSALQSVANPEESSYIFFVADCNGVPGSHLFSVTYEEHLARVNACR